MTVIHKWPIEKLLEVFKTPWEAAEQVEISCAECGVSTESVEDLLSDLEECSLLEESQRLDEFLMKEV